MVQLSMVQLSGAGCCCETVTSFSTQLWLLAMNARDHSHMEADEYKDKVSIEGQ